MCQGHRAHTAFTQLFHHFFSLRLALSQPSHGAEGGSAEVDAGVVVTAGWTRPLLQLGKACGGAGVSPPVLCWLRVPWQGTAWWGWRAALQQQQVGAWWSGSASGSWSGRRGLGELSITSPGCSHCTYGLRSFLYCFSGPGAFTRISFPLTGALAVRTRLTTSFFRLWGGQPLICSVEQCAAPSGPLMALTFKYASNGASGQRATALGWGLAAQRRCRSEPWLQGILQSRFSSHPPELFPAQRIPVCKDLSSLGITWRDASKMSHADTSVHYFKIPVSHRSQLPVMLGNTSSHLFPYSNVPPSRRKSREAGSTESLCQLYTPQKFPAFSFTAAFQAFSTVRVMQSDLSSLFWRFFLFCFDGMLTCSKSHFNLSRSLIWLNKESQTLFPTPLLVTVGTDSSVPSA